MQTAWVIYDHPSDHPRHFVVREWTFYGDRPPKPDLKAYWLRNTLTEARAVIPPGTARLPRDKRDDPVILETWI